MNHTIDALAELQRDFGLVPAAQLEQLIENRDRRSLASRFCAWISGH
jgi:hypothetical protein